MDIGGTKIAAGRVSNDALVGVSVTVPTLAAEPLDVSLAQVFRAVEACMDASTAAIGICAPGPLNPKTGVVINPPNLPNWREVRLAEIVSQRFSLPCRVENDANAAGLAEVLFGAAKGMANVLYCTLSTGIGTGIILNGKIYHGKNGAAAEGGHVTIDYRSKVTCNCGTPGCIEALASGTAMAARASMIDPELNTAERIGRAAVGGNPTAARFLDETCEMIAAWLGSLVSLLDPDIIVCGGGVSRIGEPLFERLRRQVPLRTINQFAAQTPIVPAQLAADVGIIGAAAVVMEAKPFDIL